jgi:hypothetical protein
MGVTSVAFGRFSLVQRVTLILATGVNSHSRYQINVFSIIDSVFLKKDIERF